MPGLYQYLQSVQLILNTLKHLKVSHNKYKLQVDLWSWEMRWRQDAEECVRNPKLQIVWFQALILHLTHVLKVLIDLLLHRQIVRCTELLTDWLTLTDTLTDKLTYCWRANVQNVSFKTPIYIINSIDKTKLSWLTDWLID